MVKVLGKVGYVLDRQRGSQILRLQVSPHRRLTVPDYGEATLRAYTTDLRGHLARHAKAVLEER